VLAAPNDIVLFPDRRTELMDVGAIDIDELASAEPERVRRSGCAIEAARVMITDAGGALRATRLWTRLDNEQRAGAVLALSA
jgi:hypothetical protein